MQDKRKQWLVAAAVLALLMLLGGGVWGGLALRDRGAVAAQRVAVNQYGIPLLKGPLTPGGPTFGSGDRADLDTTYNGWGANGPMNDPKTQRAVIIGVQNKSKRVWHGVEAQLAVFDQTGTYLKTEPCPFGDLAPGETKQQTFGPVEANVAMFRILGYKGR